MSAPRQPKRESRIVRAWWDRLGWLCTTSSAGCGVRHAGTNTSEAKRACSSACTGEHVPGKETVFSGETRNGEDLHVSPARSGASVRRRLRIAQASVGVERSDLWSSRSVRYVQTNSRTRCPGEGFV